MADKLNLHISPIADGDRNGVVGLFRSRPDHFQPAAIEAIQADIHDCFPSLVAIAGSSICGSIICKTTALETEILWLAVSPDRERSGIGRALVERVIIRAGKRALIVKTATVTPSATDASDPYRATHRFWERCGFRNVATLPGYWPDGGDAAVFMKRA